MHRTAIVLTAIAALLGAAVLCYGAAGLLSGRGRTPTALGRFWLGLFVVIEAGPRLAGWPSGVVLAASLLALVPLALAIREWRAGSRSSTPR